LPHENRRSASVATAETAVRSTLGRPSLEWIEVGDDHVAQSPLEARTEHERRQVDADR
jgi:hypothetical protein